MHNLPLELLHLIFSLLLQRDKLECMSVCRQWEQVIHEGSLFRVICIHEEQQLDQLIERVKRYPFIGKKVEKLTMQMFLYSDYDKIEFVNLFPNLREFTIIDSNSYSRVIEIKPQQNHPWCARIKKIVEFGSKTITRTLLDSGLCKHLTFIFLTRQYYEPARDFIELLVNAPALNTLYMNYFRISIEDLELLHEVVPLLKSLLLQEMSFAVSPVPDNIKPATFLKRFGCLSSRYHGSLDMNPLLPYISHKYTTLEELTFEFDCIDSSRIDQDENTMGLMEEQRVLFKSYINKLQPGLKTLSLKLAEFEGGDVAFGFDFDILDECGCQLINLNLSKRINITVLEQLANSTQVQHLQSLNVNKMDVIVNEQVFLDWLTHFEVLKELILHFSFSTNGSETPILNLNKLLNSLKAGQLETLGLYNAQLKFDDLRLLRVHSSITDLTFSKVTFQEGIDTVISQLFPSLKRLTLDNCFQERGSFILPNTRLSYLKITNLFQVGGSHILVMTLDDSLKRLYTTCDRPITVYSDIDSHEKNMLSFPSISSQPYNAFSAIPFITIVCKFVYYFTMSNSNFHNTCY